MSPPPSRPASETLECIHELTPRGAYQDWLARTAAHATFPDLVMARLPAQERTDREALSERLQLAAEAARQVEHQSVLHCYGTDDLGDNGIAQIFELNTGTDLEQIYSNLQQRGTQLPVATVAWIVRQAAEAIAHAHSLGVVHGALNPARIALLPDGTVKVDFGLTAGAHVQDAALTDFVDLRYTRPEWATHEQVPIAAMDIWALGAILLEGLTGQPPQTAFVDDRTASRITHVPEELRAPLRAALDSKSHADGAARLASALTRIFYKSLGAHDETDGRQPLVECMTLAVRADPDLEGAVNDHADTVYPTNLKAGPSAFTQALVAREGPVQPQDFSTDDFGVGTSGAHTTDETPDDPPEGPATEAVIQVLGLPESADSELRTQAVQSQPDMPTPNLMVAPPIIGTPVTMPTPSSSSIAYNLRERPSRLTWFLAGCAVTLVLIVVLRGSLSL